MEVLLVLVASFIALLFLWRKTTAVKKMPPGPWGLPIVGYLPFLTRQPYVKMTELAKKYGNVFSVRLGSFNVLVLNDFQSIKEAFAQDAFSGRPPTIPFELSKETVENDVFFGLPWKEQRRFALHTFRDLGLGKTKMEEHIQEEVSELMKHLELNVDVPFRIRDLLGSSMSNNITSLVFGSRLKYGDSSRQMLTKTINEISSGLDMVAWLIFFPWIKETFRFLRIGNVDRLRTISKEMERYITKEINEHEATLNPNNIRDFIDGYLLEIKKRKNDPCFTKVVLHDIVGAFFGAGSETVRQSVEWLVLCAATDQEAQRRVQAEIKEVIGPNRMPVWMDHKRMPYSEAFMMEVMRWRTLIPLNIIRYTLSDTELNGYFIPKHTKVFANLWAVHHDPKFWGEDAENFRPERFLTEDGKEVKRFECFIPFSLGKRSCPGERLATVEVYLYFVAILQKFNLRLPEGNVADFDGDLGIGLQPRNQEVIFTKRE